MKQAHAMQNMTGAIAQQNAMMAAQLTKQEQIADARRNLLNIEEQFNTVKNTIQNYPEYSSLILDDLEQASNMLIPIFTEFNDIERATQTSRTIGQFNQSMKVNFSDSRIKVLNSLKTYPQILNDAIAVRSAKEQLSENQPELKRLDTKLKTKRKFSVIPVVSILLMSIFMIYVQGVTLEQGISPVIQGIPPEKMNESTYVEFGIWSVYIEGPENLENDYTMETLADLKDELRFQRSHDQITSEDWPESAVDIDILMMELALISENIHISQEEILYEWPFPLTAQWPLDINTSEVVVSFEQSSNRIKIQTLMYSPQNKCSEELNCRFLVNEFAHTYSFNETNKLASLTSSNPWWELMQFKHPDEQCKSTIVSIHWQWENNWGYMRAFENNSTTKENIRTDLDINYFPYPLLSIGYDNSTQLNNDQESPIKDSCMPINVKIADIGRSRGLTDKMNFPIMSYVAENSEMTILEVCETIYYPEDDERHQDMYYSPAQECQEQIALMLESEKSPNFSLLFILTLAILVLVLTLRSRKHREIIRNSRRLESIVNASDLGDRTLEEFDLLIREYTLFLQTHIPHSDSDQIQTALIDNELPSNDNMTVWDAVQAVNPLEQPSTDAIGIPDDKGYEWTKSEDGSDWYRILGSNSEWQRFEA